ncbi:uncharacterized protein [Physcomitrium patens]|uniref:Complex 1 LYR protein domain-containing protein n=1 Tax=Physcomitrium patens TaxID=3218 RepID=A0A7I4D2D8_PHYPA|nr:uncharacterized protein LOC112277769 isoform X2 [Physcomitrium patens]|eukprot:XP_024366240.1 uncharacterized protein LOC112277769 isoform X2 [Physcomitrella patens]
MQHGIPAHIVESARCHGNREVLKSLVREQFRRNMHETDPEKIEEQKQAAARALFNHMYYEAGRMAAEQAENELIKESLLGLPKPALEMTLQDEDNKASS